MEVTPWEDLSRPAIQERLRKGGAVFRWKGPWRKLHLHFANCICPDFSVGLASFVGVVEKKMNVENSCGIMDGEMWT